MGQELVAAALIAVLRMTATQASSPCLRRIGIEGGAGDGRAVTFHDEKTFDVGLDPLLGAWYQDARLLQGPQKFHDPGTSSTRAGRKSSMHPGDQGADAVAGEQLTQQGAVDLAGTRWTRLIPLRQASEAARRQAEISWGGGADAARSAGTSWARTLEMGWPWASVQADRLGEEDQLVRPEGSGGGPATSAALRLKTSPVGE